jgi:transcription elongation factor/antiterminator RfaH
MTKQMTTATRKTLLPQQPVSLQPIGASLSSGSGERWYAVQTHPRREATAQLQLQAQGFRTFLPRYVKTVRHARKLTTVSAPFFPRYLFIVLDLHRDRWRSINGTFGVTSLLKANDHPVAVPAEVVEALAAQCSAIGNVRLAETLEVGQSTKILNGPFADLIGQLVRFDGGGRVQVLLQLLGGNIRVDIDRRALMPATAA